MAAWRDTSMGHGPERFPETAWSMVLQPAEGEQARRQALERLCTHYWRPVYRYVRGGGRSVEEAKDLTQEFFGHLIEGDMLSRYDREKGRFRTFLKGALKLYMAQATRSRMAQKRGGGKRVVSIDAVELERSDWLGDPRTIDSEEAFDRQWAADVVNQAMIALGEQLRAEGKELQLQVYEHYELEEHDPQPTYQQVGEAFELTGHQVKNYLAYVRKRLHRCVVDVLSDCVTSPAELMEEMKELVIG